MAIDPSIVLGLKPPPVLDIQGALEKGAQYRNLISETQYRDQQRQTNEQEEKRKQQQNAEADRKLAGDQLEGQLIAANSKTNPDGSVQTDHDAVRQGLASKGQGDRAATYLTRVQIPAEKSSLDNAEAHLKNGKAKIQAMGGILQSLVPLPDDQLPQAYDQNRQQAIQDGIAKEGDVPPAAQILQQGGVQALRQFVTQHAQAAVDADKQIDNHRQDLDFAQKVLEFKQTVAEKAPKIAKDWTDSLSQLFGAAHNADQWDGAQKTAMGLGAPLNVINQFGDFGPDAVKRANELGKTAEQKATAENQAATLLETQTRDKEAARHNKTQEGIEGSRLTLEKQKAGFEMSGGISETAKMAAAGQMDPQTLRSAIRRSPGLLNQIRQVDPNFDEANIDSRYNTLKEFTSTSTGKAGGQAIALNTLIHHADLYLEAADALKNGSFTPGNEAYNKVASLFGSAPPNNAALVARFLAGETGKVATGGVPAEGEIKGILSSLGTNASPQQMKEAGTKLLQIAAGRATPLMERVKQDKLENVVHILGPDAQEILSRRGFDPKTMKSSSADSGSVASIVLKDGRTLHPKDQAAADKFKKDHPELIQ